MTARQDAAQRMTRRRWLTGFSATVLGLTGCNSFNLFHTQPDNKGSAQKPVPPVGAPWQHDLRIAPYLFYADFVLDPNDPVFRSLANLRDQVYKELQLTPGNSFVEVYLFEDRPRYKAFLDTQQPGLPDRRAYFIAYPSVGGCKYHVYAFWDREKIVRDLRHELTHALLNSVLKTVPLWLDEGLAEYFELPPDRQGLNVDYVQKLRTGDLPFQPDMARLENLTEVREMNTPEYRESWAWVYLMLRGRPELKPVLLDYLRQLRSTAKPAPLRPALVKVLPSLDKDLLKCLNRVNLDRVAATQR